MFLFKVGKPAAFDVTVASPLTPATLNEASASAGAAAHVAENRKHAANDTKCQELGWTCIPLVVETYGNWGKEAQYVFSRVASLLAVGQSSPKPKMVAEIYGRLNLSLVRSLSGKGHHGKGDGPRIDLLQMLNKLYIVLIVSFV